jgi:N-dimethylarginine dimethylaminohydrolase
MLHSGDEIYCFNEYDNLQKVVVSQPKYMKDGKVLHVVNGQSHKETIDIDKAMSQHGEFVKTLRAHDIEVIFLPPQKQYSEGVFTRDIGFALGEEMFVEKMALPPRIGEEQALIDLLRETGITHHTLKKDRVEGGDVMIDNQSIYIGISSRTYETSVSHLRLLLPQFEVISLPFSDEFLHLDCLFNILSPTDALIYPGELSKENEAMLASRYHLIEVSKEEQATLGTNVLSIGAKKVLSLPMNDGVNKQLQDRGYDVIEIDFSEIIKVGGSFRCCSLPLSRKK